MIARTAAALALTLALVSCQMPTIPLRAAYVDGVFSFVGDDGYEEHQACWRELAVHDDRGEPVWHVEGPHRNGCGRAFPIAYGRTPQGTEVEVAPGRLEPGRLYLVRGDTDLPVTGAFSLSRAGERWLVHNLDRNHPAVVALFNRVYRITYPPSPTDAQNALTVP